MGMVQRKGTPPELYAFNADTETGNKLSWLTSESVEEEKQTGKQRTPWHCYHQPLISTRSVEDSSTVTVRAGNPLVSRI